MKITMTIPDANSIYRGEAPPDLLNRILGQVQFSGIAQIRAGQITVSVLDLSKAIVFDAPLTDANYIVIFQAQSSISAALWPTAQTANGFTLNLGVGVASTIGWVAIGIPDS
jgi:hypothetical protein